MRRYHHKGSDLMAMAARYEFRVAERLTDTELAAFPELARAEAVIEGDVLFGPIRSQEQLHSLLARFRTMRITVIELRQLPD
jgi:hypothetical protein